MEFKGIQKEREPWVKVLIVILAIVLLVREVMMKQYIYVPIALLVVVACFFRKEHVFSEEGVDIKYLIFNIPMHNYWSWDEVTTIHTDYKKASPNVMVHIGKDIVTRTFIMKPSVCRDALTFAAKMNPDIFIDNPTAEEQERREQDIMNRQKAERARRAAKIRKRKK